ncbi:hypothetical protein RBB50_000217 [Rhinocladiella similis]
MPNEQTPLLGSYAYGDSDEYPPVVDPHDQFCMMVGIPSSAPDAGRDRKSVPRKSLYGRVTRQLAHQRWTYYTTASLSNTMLLTQVVLGAALTALGASESSHILITIFGALNTVIAGMVAYLKSRGQPMRARMYRDDLERVVDEIENSEIMWLGISRHVHGYDEIDTDDGQVSVRSEVARLTRLYDRAVKSNTMNNPDMYMANGGYDGAGAQLRSRPGGVPQGAAALPALPIAAGPPQPVIAAPVVQPNLPQPTPAAAAPVQTAPDPDESPATAPPKPKEEPKKEEPKKEDAENKDKKDGEKDQTNGDGGGGDSDGSDTTKEKDRGKEPPTKDSSNNNKGGESSSSSSAPEGTEPSPAEGSSSPPQPQPQPSPPQPPPPAPAPVRDPDASPASDPNVPLKKD